MRRRPAGIVVALWAVGCGGTAVPGPPDIAYGVEECSYCRMIVSEERYAAAATVDGTDDVFDDIGCLLAALERRTDPPSRLWVHDGESGEWIEATEAFFVSQPRGTTPMGSGIVAFGTAEAARSRVGAAGTIYDWKELVASGIGLQEPEEENRG